MKIVAVSDLHGNFPYIEPCDILIIAGDIVPLKIQTNYHKSYDWFYHGEFKEWIDGIDCKQVILVFGNHDFFGRGIGTKVREVWFNKPVAILENEAVSIEGEDKTITVWGSPYVRYCGNWAFVEIDKEKMRNMYETMPENCDICITHDAPDIGEMGVIHDGYYTGERAGNIILSEVIKEKKPKYAISGHIHSSQHGLQIYDENPDTKYATVSILDESYEENYEPLVFEI